MLPPEVFVYVNSTSPSSPAAGGGADCHSQKEDHWIVGTPIANPMSGYGGYKKNRTLWGIDAIGTGDALLIAGKGHETGQIVGHDVYPFDDAEQASVAVAALDGRI